MCQKVFIISQELVWSTEGKVLAKIYHIRYICKVKFK